MEGFKQIESPENKQQIGNVFNYYGGLSVCEHEGKFYWGIENYNGTWWEEISEELYHDLISKAPVVRND